MLNKKAKEEIRSGILPHLPDLASQVVVAIIWFVLIDFFEFFSIYFFFSLVIVGCGAWLLYRRRFRQASLAMLCWLLFVVVVAFSSHSVILSDQGRWRYRTSPVGSVLEIPNLPIPSSVIHLLWRDQNLMEVTQCDGEKVVKLPFLPFPSIATPPPGIPRSPFSFRRLPPATLAEVEVLVEVGRPDAQVSTEPADSWRSVSAGVHIRRNVPYPITSIFPRNIRCVFSDVVAIPILEYLSWVPENVEGLLVAVEANKKLRQSYRRGVFNVDVLRSINELPLTGDYKTIFSFISNRIASFLLQGNIVAELRADLRNNACIIVAANPKLFDGLFSPIRNSFYNEILSVAGVDYQNIYEACNIPQEFTELFRSTATQTEKPEIVKLYERCVSVTSTKEGFAKCLSAPIIDGGYANQISDHKNIPTRRSSEDILSYLEAPFAQYVVKPDNLWAPVNFFTAYDCPELKDKAEQLVLISYFVRTLQEVFHDQRFCTERSSIEIQSRILQLRAAYSCAWRRGLAQHRSEQWFEEMIVLRGYYRCGDNIAFDDIVKMDLYQDLSVMAPEILAASREVRKFSFLLPEESLSVIADGLATLAAIYEPFCKEEKLSDCINNLKKHPPEWMSDVRATIQKFAEENGILRKGIVSENSSARDWIEASPKKIVHMIVCNALVDSKIATEYGVEREKFCTSHGLRRYMRIADTIFRETAYRSFTNEGPFSTSGAFTTHGYTRSIKE